MAHEIGGEQPLRAIDQTIDCGSLAIAGGAQGTPVATAGEEIRLGVAQLVSGGEQLRDRRALRADELIDRPGCDRWLAQARDRGRLIAASVRAQRAGQRATLRDEALERQAVEVRLRCVAPSPTARRRASRR
jgi:hypothetical protein